MAGREPLVEKYRLEGGEQRAGQPQRVISLCRRRPVRRGPSYFACSVILEPFEEGVVE